MITKLRNKFRNDEGITLVEVLVSISLFGVALSTISFLLTSNLFNADALRNNTIAAGLAQEGIEIGHNIRDKEWLTTGTFGNNLPDGTYEVQWNSTSLTPSSSRYIKKDPTNGFFSYDSGNDTIFKRTITISTISVNEKIIKSTITWIARDGNKSLEAEEHIFDWYP